jgi:MYXO-CTERM domain-containing protein
MRPLAFFSLFAALLGLAPAPVLAQTCVMNGTLGGSTNHWQNAGTTGPTPGCPALDTSLGGLAGFGTGVLAMNDDSSSAAIDLTPAFPGGLNFYGGPYHTMYVNNNGNITFNGTLFTYTPSAFPLPAPTGGAMPAPMIAAYWSDIDTRRPVANGGPVTANHDLVYWDLRPGQVTVTWFDTGYFSSKYNHRMSFQMILRNGSGCGMGDFDVEFRYNVCGFTTGDVSGGTDGHGGTAAQVGFDADDGVNYVSIPESLTAAVENVCITSNTTPPEPGVYRFGVRGGHVTCAGGGTACTTGMTGACGIGVNVCHASGVVCEPIGTSSPESCDNIDNDCNGMVDDGSHLCPGSQICVQGSCINNCLDGGCATGFTCNPDGRCVEDACVSVTCPANQRCIHGTCMDSCTGVVCPHNQQCAAGRCTDVCAVVTCDTGYVCQDGMCVGQCPCNACPTGQVCNADGSCSEPGCDIVTCNPGEYCAAGTCMDACAGTMCPANQHCEVGNCVPTVAYDAGHQGFDAGIPREDTGIVMPGDDGGTVGPGADGGRGPRRTSGCGCRVGSSESGAGGYLALLVLGLWAARRRRLGGA